MSRKKRSGQKPPSGDKPEREGQQETDGSQVGARRYVPSSDAIRETIESVVIAFVLAFLFRTFEAEAFVIPTGSMAPTLMGRNKDLVCPECGYPFEVSASEEVDSRTNVSLGPDYQVIGCTCPMCGYPIHLRPEDKSFKGDRILVNKFAYQFADPQRWDVAVFEYPGGAATNFIKRIVGLPRETIRISHGDLWVKRPGQDGFTIARKPASKLLAMLQPVYDNDYALRKLIDAGWPPRWQPVPSPGGTSDGAWVTSEDYKSFSISGPAEGESWLRYQQFVPSPAQWRYVMDGTLADPALRAPKPQLISDFCSYNTNRDRQHGRQVDPDSLGLYWVGDLAVQCELVVEKAAGEAIFELVEGGRRMQCRIDLGTGRATLSISGLADFHRSAPTGVRAPGSYQITFSNVDDQLLLWVDGEVVPFDRSTAYAPLGNTRPQAADLSPVGIGSSGPAGLRVNHLKVFRDIYYISGLPSNGQGSCEFEYPWNPYLPCTSENVTRFLSSPSEWEAFDHMRPSEFALGADQFLALGDNSPKSKDSRLWGKEFYVSRRLLIGKALFVYWPHGWDKIPGTDIPFPLGMFPNFKRMGFVR
jgi:signal peptidase I